MKVCANNIYVCMHLVMYGSRNPKVCTYVYKQICMSLYMSMYLNMYVGRLHNYVLICACMYICVFMYVCRQAYVSLSMYICMYVDIHV